MASVKVNAIQNTFLTRGHDRNDDNGVSESIVLMPNQRVLGQNQSWGKGITFRNGNVDLGQRFDLSADNIMTDMLPNVQYRWMMDTGGEWDVLFKIEVTLADGRTFIVFQDGQAREINGGNPKGPPNGAIPLSNPVP
jgi:hypothetical protein